jgi:exosortase
MSTAAARRAVSIRPGASVAKFLVRWWWLPAAFLLVYTQILRGLFTEWWTNGDYAHGLFTPLAIAYVAYERRRALSNIVIAPSVLGFPLIVASQAMLIVGSLGAEFFLQRTSILVFLAGLVLFLRGWQALSKTAFALVLILLAIPLPAVVFNSIALPLQLLASTMSESVLDLLHIPVYREGNILQLPGHLMLNVSEACSGIRSLVTLIALAALTTMLARYIHVPPWARFLFVASAIPVALVANAVRVTGTGLLAYEFGSRAAEGFFHSFSGALVFVFAFAVLLPGMVLLSRLFSDEGQPR